jgi:ATP-dependent exoDNAse (exonuclease V) beta subunit (contains helicase and exonuclease domains)
MVGNTDLTFGDFLTELDLVFREESIDGILEFVYEKSGILEYYNRTNDYQAVANLIKLKNIAGDILSREYMQPLDFLEYLNRKIQSRAEEDESEIDDSDKKRGAVTVMTIHKAKGLSLPVVIVPHIDRRLINSDKLPAFVIDKENKQFEIGDIGNQTLTPSDEFSKLLNAHIAENLEEELRVLYVAMTRAERLLVLSAREDRAWKDNVSWHEWVK